MYTRVHASFRSPHVSVVLLQVQMEFVVRSLAHLRGTDRVARKESVITRSGSIEDIALNSGGSPESLTSIFTKRICLSKKFIIPFRVANEHPQPNPGSWEELIRKVC